MNGFIYFYYHFHYLLLKIKKNHPAPIFSTLIAFNMTFFSYFICIVQVCEIICKRVLVTFIDKHLFIILSLVILVPLNFFVISEDGYSGEVKEMLSKRSKKEHLFGMVLSASLFLLSLVLTFISNYIRSKMSLT
jgi:hypothetical protein